MQIRIIKGHLRFYSVFSEKNLYAATPAASGHRAPRINSMRQTGSGEGEVHSALLCASSIPVRTTRHSTTSLLNIIRRNINPSVTNTFSEIIVKYLVFTVEIHRSRRLHTCVVYNVYSNIFNGRFVRFLISCRICIYYCISIENSFVRRGLDAEYSE